MELLIYLLHTPPPIQPSRFHPPVAACNVHANTVALSLYKNPHPLFWGAEKIFATKDKRNVTVISSTWISVFVRAIGVYR